MSQLIEIGLTNAALATGLAVLAAAVERLGRRPALGHALWLLVLIKLITPPLVGLPVPWPAAPRPAVVAPEKADLSAAPHATAPAASARPAQAAAIKTASEGELKGILGAYSEPLVSTDFNHDSHSSIFALNEVKVVEGTFVRVLSWYDNEWGFSCRMSDTAVAMMNAKA